ncbi:MAG: hypothetical protein KAS96_08475 [Planctomycetes bacterium]|nr:hypothetical protein [Planctomycetota bacterium]
MTLTGKQKAALLLMSLDTPTATKLLKDIDPDTVQDIAVELAYLDANGYRSGSASIELTNQFCNGLNNKPKLDINDFLDQMLKTTVGEKQAENIQQKIPYQLQRRDPFMYIRSASAENIAKTLESEHPQAIAIALSELPAKKSSKLLGLLSDGVRLSTVARMTTCSSVTIEAKVKIAQLIEKRIKAMQQSGQAAESGSGTSDGSLRKTAVILRNLKTEIRDTLLETIKEKDSQAGESISNLMIIWEDIPLVKDRSMQEILREIDVQKLALALIKADEVIVKKVKDNISERAAATLDEETSLMSDPKMEDIEEARETIVATLREINKKGELDFIEEEE